MPLLLCCNKSSKKKMLSLITVTVRELITSSFCVFFRPPDFPEIVLKIYFLLHLKHSIQVLGPLMATAPFLHYARRPSASSLLTQKLDKKATVGKRQDSETETHGSSCWAQQLIRGNKFVPSEFVWRSGQWPSGMRGGLFVHGVICPSGPFSIPWTSWPRPPAAPLAPSPGSSLLNCNEHILQFPNWLCNRPNTLP